MNIYWCLIPPDGLDPLTVDPTDLCSWTLKASVNGIYHWTHQKGQTQQVKKQRTATKKVSCRSKTPKTQWKTTIQTTSNTETLTNKNLKQVKTLKNTWTPTNKRPYVCTAWVFQLFRPTHRIWGSSDVGPQSKEKPSLCLGGVFGLSEGRWLLSTEKNEEAKKRKTCRDFPCFFPSFGHVWFLLWDSDAGFWPSPCRARLWDAFLLLIGGLIEQLAVFWTSSSDQSCEFSVAMPYFHFFSLVESSLFVTFRAVWKGFLPRIPGVKGWNGSLCSEAEVANNDEVYPERLDLSRNPMAVGQNPRTPVTLKPFKQVVIPT